MRVSLFSSMMSSITLLLVFFSSPTWAATNHLSLLSELFPAAHQQLFRNLRDQKMNPSYEFDVGRTPEEALKEGMGGACNTHARTAALTLMKNGVPAEDLRIVSAVNNSSLDALCLGKKAKAAQATRDGLAGHVFLLIKSGAGWYLVNTTTVPKTPPAQKFGPLGLEYAVFISPQALDAQMKAGPVRIPNTATGSLPPSIFGTMTIFSSVRPDRYPLHDFSGRRRLVASGNLASDVCRYNGSAKH